MLRIPSSTAIRIAFAAVTTPLVFVVTMIFTINVPATKGIFNVGETMVYAVALLFGPFVGSFAGGVGSMLADILLGLPHYAFATLVIKACEGGVVGFLGSKKPMFSSKLWKTFTVCAGLIAGVSLGIIGTAYYSGTVELYLGIPPPQTPNVIFFVPPVFWYFLGALVIFLIALTGFVVEPAFGWLVFTTLIGGAIMVTGYFLYQQFLLVPLFGIEVVAIAEIPVNIGQMLVGLIVALPLVKIVFRSLPQFKS